MSYHRLVLDRRKFLKRKVWRTRLTLWLAAVFIALVATALAVAGDFIEIHFKQLLQRYPYFPIFVTPLGFFLITWLTQRYLFAAQGSGIPQTIAAIKMKNHAQRSKVLSFSIAFGKSILVLMGLMCGASIGRGGPTIHIGAAIAYAFTRFARFPFHETGRGLILAGAAAGLTAAFNTPLAGIMFTIEEMTRNFEEKINPTIIIVVIIGSIVYMGLLGNYRYFEYQAIDIAQYQTILLVIFCGLAGGLIGGLFTAILILGSRKISPVRRSHPYWFALGCGLIVALIGLASNGHSFGTGYFEVVALLNNPDVFYPEYALAKMLATVVSYLSGIPGGIFTPTLSIGAGMGAEIGQLVATVMTHGIPAQFIILLSMAAYFTGVVQTPITASILLVEMTGSIELFLPLLATSLIANGVARYFNSAPIYRSLAAEFLKDMKFDENRESQQPDKKVSG